MLANYLQTALRQLLKNKSYALVNLLGLTVGLLVYLFGNLLVSYERSHDTGFAHHERIYTVGVVFGPTAEVGVSEVSGVQSAFGPLIANDIPELEAVARTVSEEFLISVGDNHFYEDIRFADPELLQVFDFEYLEGDARALEVPDGILLTRAMADKYFGPGPALGRTLQLDHEVNLRVTAVIADLGAHTHFNASIVQDNRFTLVAPLEALNAATEYDVAGNWNNLSMGDNTYFLVPPERDRQWLQTQMDGVFDRHFPEDRREFVDGLRVRPLVEVQTMLWDAIGLPVLDSVRILALLVLVIAIVNYTNLATAQSLGRAKEVGLRKTMGASRGQLLGQFLVESLLLVTLAMLLALVLTMLVVPFFNAVTGREVVFSLLNELPWLLLTTLATGLVAGAYPAWLISRASPIDALRGGVVAGGGSWFRSAMLGLQFAITVFMLAMVMVVYLQNLKVKSSSNIYPRTQILTLKRLDVDAVQARLPTLREQLLRVDGVTEVSFSDLLPYQQSSSSFSVGLVPGDDSNRMSMNRVTIDDHFVAAYDIPLLAGRNLNIAIAGDTVVEDAISANVLVNELALNRLGLPAGDAAIGRQFYDYPDDRETRVYTIAGVIPDQNFQGFHNTIKPTAFVMMPTDFRFASIRVQGDRMDAVLPQVERIWETLIPAYPIQTEFLDDTFQEVFRVFEAMSGVLSGFALVALVLSLVGLFGLAAFMAQGRTREIGIRKVMGASISQILLLLIWQFSRPVIWSVCIALPAAYFASNIYLNFFAERIGLQLVIVAAAGVIAVMVSWAVVAVHAYAVARTNPIRALRYE